MDRPYLCALAASSCLILATACESKQRRPRTRRPSTQRTSGSVAAAGGGAQKVSLPQGHVAFVLTDADLASEVIPLFMEQAGVALIWRGPERRLSLRLTNSLPWDEALDLVCQFTKTHVTTDYQNRLILKDGWSGRPTSETLGDLTKHGTQGSGSVSSGTSSSSSSGSRRPRANRSSSSSGAKPNATPYGSAYSGGDAAKRILQGTTTSQAGR